MKRAKLQSGFNWDMGKYSYQWPGEFRLNPYEGHPVCGVTVHRGLN